MKIPPLFESEFQEAERLRMAGNGPAGMQIYLELYAELMAAGNREAAIHCKHMAMVCAKHDLSLALKLAGEILQICSPEDVGRKGNVLRDIATALRNAGLLVQDSDPEAAARHFDDAKIQLYDAMEVQENVDRSGWLVTYIKWLDLQARTGGMTEAQAMLNPDLIKPWVESGGEWHNRGTYHMHCVIMELADHHTTQALHHLGLMAECYMAEGMPNERRRWQHLLLQAGCLIHRGDTTLLPEIKAMLATVEPSTAEDREIIVAELFINPRLRQEVIATLGLTFI